VPLLSARYVKVVVDDVSYGVSSVNEIYIYNFSEVNIAAGKPTTGTSHGYPPTNATDGNAGNWWSVNLVGQYALVDLGSTIDISKIVLDIGRLDYAYQAVKGYTIYTSNDSIEWKLSASAINRLNISRRIDTHMFVNPSDLQGNVYSPLSIGSNTHTVNGFLTTSTYTGGITTPIRDAVLIGNETTGTRAQPNRQGSYGIQLGAKTKVKTVRQGVLALSGSKAVTKIITAKPAKIIPYKAQGLRKRPDQSGVLLRTFTVDSNAANKFNVIVNATHQYKTQTITVNSTTTQNLVGQWSFSVGNSVIIQPSVSGPLNSITFSVDPAKLNVGKNRCSLILAYTDGTTEFVPLLITKEPIKRTSVERTFKQYDGGYTTTGITTTNDYGGLGVVMCPSVVSGTILTTDNTAVNLDHYGGIISVNAECSGAFFLVSFDGSSGPWWTFNGTSFIQATPETISTVGMTGKQLNSITQTQWSTVFKQTQLDIMCYLDNAKSITVIPSYTEVDHVHGSILYNVGTHTYTDGSVISSGSTYNITKPSGYNITRIAGSSYTDSESGGSTIKINSNTHSLFPINQGKRTVEFDYIVPYDEVITNLKIAAYYVNGYGGGAASVSYTVYIKPSIAYLKSINITLPANLPPSITNVSLTPSTLHSGNAVLTATVADPEGDDVQYRVTVNTDEIIPRTDFAQGPAQIEATISADSCSVGTNAITIEATDGDKISTPYTTYLTRTNFNPNITGILTGKYLNAVIGDQDGDQIKYRILVNNIVKQDWSLLIDSPAVVKYTIPKSSVIVGSQNKVTIEAIDSLGGAGNCDFDFVGQYYGLMFSDETGNYYSDDVGNTLRTLDLGSFLIGRSSNIQAIVIKNTTGVEIKDIIISADIDSLPDGVTVRFGLTESNFEDLSEAAIPVALGYNDEYMIYVKVTCDEEEAVGNSILKLNAIGVITQ
jgi:hypothetical protein